MAIQEKFFFKEDDDRRLILLWKTNTVDEIRREFIKVGKTVTCHQLSVRATYLRKHNISLAKKYGDKTVWKDEEIEMLKKCLQNRISCVEIARSGKLDRSACAIWQEVKRLRKIKKALDKNFMNEQYFEKIEDEEQKISVCLSNKVVNVIDAIAENERVTRSKAIENIILLYLSEKGYMRLQVISRRKLIEELKNTFGTKTLPLDGECILIPIKQFKPEWRGLSSRIIDYDGQSFFTIKLNRVK